MEHAFEITEDIKGKTFEQVKDNLELKIEEIFAKKEICEKMSDEDLKKEMKKLKEQAIAPLRAKFISDELADAIDIIIKKYDIEVVSCAFATEQGIGNVGCYSDQVSKLSKNLKNSILSKLLNDVYEDIK